MMKGESKECKRCGEVKSASEFIRSKAGYLSSQCKPCRNKLTKLWRDENKEKVRESKRKWAKENPDKVRKMRDKQRSKDPQAYLEAHRERCKKYRENNPGAVKTSSLKYQPKANTKQVERRASDEMFRVKHSLRNHILRALKGFLKSQKTEALLGCSFNEARAHIESQFSDGMTWANHGEWHLDHKTPLASAKTLDDAEKLCHYTNLQPLWAIDNLRKGSNQ